jgi:hypothetical protein
MIEFISDLRSRRINAIRDATIWVLDRTVRAAWTKRVACLRRRSGQYSFRRAGSNQYTKRYKTDPTADPPLSNAPVFLTPLASSAPLVRNGMRHAMSTARGLLCIGASYDQRFHAFESKTGKLLWDVKIAANAEANSITYLGKNAKQHV